MQDGAAFKLLGREIEKTISAGLVAHHPDTQAFAKMLGGYVARLGNVTQALYGANDVNLTLANATAYLEAFGHVVMAWIWLEQSLAASKNFAPADSDFYHGKWQACRYFFVWELPKVSAMLDLLESLDKTTLEMKDAWF
jgi:hypothetical protein